MNRMKNIDEKIMKEERKRKKKERIMRWNEKMECNEKFIKKRNLRDFQKRCNFFKKILE